VANFTDFNFSLAYAATADSPDLVDYRSNCSYLYVVLFNFKKIKRNFNRTSNKLGTK